MGMFSTVGEEFRTRNFSIYGQWTGIISIIICLAVGISNIFHFDIQIVFAVFAIVTGLLIIFLEIPFLLRICPTSAAFDTFIRRFQSLWGRAAFYITASIVQWLSIIPYATSLIAAAVLLLFAGIFYAIAALKGQDFMGSKALGGQSVAQMIV